MQAIETNWDVCRKACQTIDGVTFGWPTQNHPNPMFMYESVVHGTKITVQSFSLGILMVRVNQASSPNVVFHQTERDSVSRIKVLKLPHKQKSWLEGNNRTVKRYDEEELIFIEGIRNKAPNLSQTYIGLLLQQQTGHLRNHISLSKQKKKHGRWQIYTIKRAVY